MVPPVSPLLEPDFVMMRAELITRTVRPAVAPLTRAASLVLLAMAKPGDWACDECGASPNFARRTECFRCGAPKPRDARPADRTQPEFRSGRNQPEFRENFEGTRVFVENLSYDTTWGSLKDAFIAEGYPVVYASVSTTPRGESKGHGIVQFETSHAAQHAMDSMTGYELDGRTLNVRPDYQEQNRRQGLQGSKVGDWECSECGAFPNFARRTSCFKCGAPRPAEDTPTGASSPERRPPREGSTSPRTNARDPWKAREWSRVAGSDDEGMDVDEAVVMSLLEQRDAAREARDYSTADRLLDELQDLGVYVNDARRQRAWWVGRRADGGNDERRQSRGRRQWYSEGGGEVDGDQW